MLKAVDFFCGAGGMSCGFKQAGVKILAGVDIEKQFEQTFLANNKKAKFFNKDIVRYQPEELQKAIALEKFDDKLIFIGCSPCQYWSKISTNKHQSSYTSNLLYDFQRFVNYFRPGYVVVENVPGLLSKNNNYVLLEFLDFLILNGYNVKYNIVRTDHFGVPQRRKRFVLIASRVSEEFEFPEPEINPNLTVRKFIGVERGFPILEAGNMDQNDPMNSTSRLSLNNIRRLKVTPPDGGTRMAWKDDPNLQIPAYHGKDEIFRSIYGRMFWDEPAPTITTRFLAISCGRFAHPEQNRGLSLREGATLQTFPSDYIFKGSMISIAKQIGNAVPPEMARRIALSIINN